MNEGVIDLDAIEAQTPDRAPASEAIDLDAIEAQAQAPEVIDLDAVEAQVQEPSRLDKFLDTLVPAGPRIALKAGIKAMTFGADKAKVAKEVIDSATADPTSAAGLFKPEWELAKGVTSTVGKGLSGLLDVLAVPAHMVASGAIEGGEYVAPGIKKKLNPNGEIVPDVMMNDVVNYMTPDPDQIEQDLRQKGYSNYNAAALSSAYWGARTGLGLALTVLSDPLMAGKVKVLQRTAESLAAYKAGDIANAGRRSLISLGAPFTDRRVDIAIPKRVVEMSTKGAAAIGDTRVGQKVSKVTSEFLDWINPFTGDLEVDIQASANSAIKRGVEQRLLNLQKEAKRRPFTNVEAGLINDAIENTPNLRVSFYGVAGDAAKKTGMSPDELSTLARERIRKMAAEKKITLTPLQEDELLKGVMDTKGDLSDVLGIEMMNGIENAGEIAMIEEYLPHIISKEGKNYLQSSKELKKSGKEFTREAMEKIASVIEADATKELAKSINPKKTLTTFDPSRQFRKYRSTLQTANDIMKEKTGVSKWFVDDPYAIRAQYLSKRYKYIADKSFLEAIRKKGIRPDTTTVAGRAKKRELIEEGWAPIKHPEFDGKTVLIREGEKTVKVRHDDILFPPNIAKLSYQFTPRPPGGIENVNAMIDTHIRMFRTTALFKLDYWLENWMEDLVKGFANGVRHDDYVDSFKVINNSKGTIRVLGKDVPVSEVKKITDTFSVRSSQHLEGVDSLLYTGKAMMKDHNTNKVFRTSVGNFVEKSSEVSKKALGMVGGMGDRGQNYLRTAFFLNRLKNGYTPAVAAWEVERYLFDFSRISPGIAMSRRFINPFIQVQIKTAQVMPRLIANNPGFYNAYQNILPHVIERSFHDPLTAEAIKGIYPEYDQFRSRLAGPIMTGNTQLTIPEWWAEQAGKGGVFSYKRWSGEPAEGSVTGMPGVLNLNVPAGLDVVDGLALWNPHVLQQTTSGGILRALSIAAFGNDPQFGKSVNIDLDVPKEDITINRINKSIAALGQSAVALPVGRKTFDSLLGIRRASDELFYEPWMVSLMNSQLGKFGKVTNLDKEFYFRLINLEKTKKTLEANYKIALQNDLMSRNATIPMQNAPLIRDAINYFKSPKSTVAIGLRMAGNIEELLKVTGNAQWVKKEMSLPEMAGWIENIKETQKTLKATYGLGVVEYQKMADQYGVDYVLKADEKGEKPEEYVVPKEDVSSYDELFDED